MTDEYKIQTLQIHRLNLEEAVTLEDYKKAHIAYIDFLIKTISVNADKVKAYEEALNELTCYKRNDWQI